MDHLDLLFEFTDQLQELDLIQTWIDQTRFVNPTNQIVQLTLDRQQSDLNRKRFTLAAMMADIRSRN